MPRSIDEARKEVWTHFKDMQRVYLATAEVDQPRVRPITLLDLDEKFWIATGTRSAKALQIQRNPNVEFCLPLREETGEGYIRVSGVASVITDQETRAQIGGRIPFLADYWEGAHDPDFCLIRITRVEVEYMKPGEDAAATFMV